MSQHPAFEMIGAPYAEDGQGPDSFNCWGAVRHYFERCLGIEMPLIAVGQIKDDSPENTASIRRAAAAGGWRPTADKHPAAHDIVIMESIEGKHVGVMIEANGSLQLMHSIEPHGVCVQPLDELPRLGFSRFEFWHLAGGAR